MKKHDILSLLVAASLFLILALVLEVDFVLSIIIAVFSFGITFFLTKPDPKYIDYDELNEATAIELENLYTESLEKVSQIELASQRISHPQIQSRAHEIILIGNNIMNYLEDKPHLVSDSRYFLSYYLDKTERILTSYHQIETGNLSSGKLEEIQDQTYESLSYLKQVFQNQNDAYHTKTAEELAIENELLESTLDPDMIERTLEENEKEAQKLYEE